MKKIFLLFVLTLLIIQSSIILGTVRFVSKTGSSTPPYTSWAAAADSIQKCINISSFGDTIYVANGTYYEQVVMIPGLALIGSGMDSCVIDTRALAEPTDFMAVRVKESGSIEGFRIIVSNSRWGTGIFLRHSTGEKHQSYAKLNKISNANLGIWIDDNDQGVCGSNIVFGTNKGIRIANFWDSQPIVENNYISNVTDDGISISFGGRPIIRNNTIVDDDLSRGIFGGGPDSLFLENNLFMLKNLLSEAIQLPSFPSKTQNNLILGDSNSRGIAALSQSTIFNNVLEGFQFGIVRGSNDNPIVKYNSFWENIVNIENQIPDSTNISVNPMFNSSDSLDFHLQKFSPLIDAGDPSILDKDGSRSDIGVYGGPYGQSYTYQDLAPRTPRNLTAQIASGKVILNWTRNTEADFKNYRVYRDTVSNFTIDTTKIAGITNTAYYYEPVVSKNNLYYKITAVDSQNNQSSASEEVGVVIVGVEEPEVKLDEFILYQNYPNPFNPSTIIGYKISRAGYVKLNVYDIKGEKIAELVNAYQNAGYYEVKYESTKMGEVPASGIYLYKLDVAEKGIPVYTSLKKMIQLK